MAIAKNPKRNQTLKTEQEAEAFISGAGTGAITAPEEDKAPKAKAKKEPVLVRVDPAMLERIDKAAARLGISRSAFMVSSAAERLERME